MALSLSSSLIDAIQKVPQLLQCVSSHCGIKVLRLVSREARVISLQAISSYGYSAKLSSPPSETGAMLRVATFLKNTKLQRLGMDVCALAGGWQGHPRDSVDILH